MPSFQRISIANTNSIYNLKKELLRFHCGCYGNKVTLAMRYVADAYCLKNLHTKYELNST